MSPVSPVIPNGTRVVVIIRNLGFLTNAGSYRAPPVGTLGVVLSTDPEVMGQSSDGWDAGEVVQVCRLRTEENGVWFVPAPWLAPL